MTVAVFSDGEGFNEALAIPLPALGPTIHAAISAVGMSKDAGPGVMIREDYKRVGLKEPMEMLAPYGSVNPPDDPVFHIHAVLGGHEFEADGGHLFGTRAIPH